MKTHFQSSTAAQSRFVRMAMCSWMFQQRKVLRASGEGDSGAWRHSALPRMPACAGTEQCRAAVRAGGPRQPLPTEQGCAPGPCRVPVAAAGTQVLPRAAASSARASCARTLTVGIPRGGRAGVPSLPPRGVPDGTGAAQGCAAHGCLLHACSVPAPGASVWLDALHVGTNSSRNTNNGGGSEAAARVGTKIPAQQRLPRARSVSV